MNTIKNEEYLREMTRLTKLKADKEELKLSVLRGELIRVEEVRRQWTENASNIRQKYLALQELAPKLEGLSAKEIRQELRIRISEILNELAEEYR